MLEKDKKENGGEAAAESVSEYDLNRLLVDYLYVFFPVYQEIKDKAWTRENELDEQLPDVSQSSSLRKILTDPGTVSAEQKGVIVFRGEREGDGKKFYLNKLIETCYEAIPHFVWSDIDKMEREGNLFRFPILVDKAAVECWLENKDAQNIVDLTAKCFITKLKLNTIQQAVAQELADKLFQKGMLALFVTEDVHPVPMQLIRRLIQLMPSTGLMPILIFLVDNSFLFEDRDGEEEKFYCIDIKPLSEYQILRYIAVELPNCTELMAGVKEHKEIVKLLSKQERLLKQIAIWKNNMNSQKDFELDILQIEEDFIRETIGDNTGLHKQLCEAAKLELQNRAIPQETLNALSETDFFYNGQFNYAESKYYLVAEEFARNKKINLRNVLQPTIEEIIKKWPEEVLLYFAAFYMRGHNTKKKRDDRFKKYFDILCTVLNNPDIREKQGLVPALIIANTMVFLGKIEEKLEGFINWTMEELKSPNYDKKIFEALSLIKDSVSDCQLEDALCKKYMETDNLAVKRRIVYFYSFAHCALPNEIVDDMVLKEHSTESSSKHPEEDSREHLNYHIISALTDTVNVSGFEEIRWVKDTFYMEWLEKDNDPIMQSELETFYFHKVKHLYKSEGAYLNKCISQLLKKFTEGVDWEKTHALGALCRMPGLEKDNINHIINQLNNLLIKELDNLPNSRDGNCLPTVRYIVEACCKLAKHESADPERTHRLLQEKFADHIAKYGREYMNPGVAFSVYITAYSVFSTLICGLAYLKKGNLSIRNLLTQEFSMERNLDTLMQECGIDSTFELWPDTCADDLEDIVQEWKTIPPTYSEQIMGTKYDNSVGQIYVNSNYAGMGFMFREHYKSGYRVYCITCTHLFAKAEQYLDKVEFELLRTEEQTRRYSMKPLYPERDLLVRELGVRASARQDVSVWVVEDIPYNVLLEMFDGNDWYDGTPEKDSELKSYGFPTGKEASVFGKTHGSFLEYIYQDSGKGFCKLKLPGEEKSDIYKSAYGYSGTPIINSEGRICAIHKGNDGNAAFIGINADIIKDILNRKEWEKNERING